MHIFDVSQGKYTFFVNHNKNDMWKLEHLQGVTLEIAWRGMRAIGCRPLT